MSAVAILQIAKSWNSGCKCRSNLCRNVRVTNVCRLSRLDCMCASGVRTQRLYRSCWTKSWALRCCCCCRMCACAMATQELLYCCTAVSLAFLCTQRECAFIFLCMHIEKPNYVCTYKSTFWYRNSLGGLARTLAYRFVHKRSCCCTAVSLLVLDQRLYSQV